MQSARLPGMDHPLHQPGGQELAARRQPPISSLMHCRGGEHQLPPECPNQPAPVPRPKEVPHRPGPEPGQIARRTHLPGFRRKPRR